MSGFMTTSVSPARVYINQQNVYGLHCLKPNAAGSATLQLYADNASKSDAVTAQTHVMIATSAAAGMSRPALAMQFRAEELERLICEAKMALASQTTRTYRQWFTCWRRRGVRVNDLLDMTWTWCRRARLTNED